MIRRNCRLTAKLSLEQLERRDAPATLINASTISYQDVDGDLVRIVFSRPILNANNVNDVFLFNTGVVDGSNATRQQLKSIKLTSLGPAASGLNITTNVARGLAGDGFVAIGQIQSEGVSLGKITIRGDLGRITAGDLNELTPGINILNVHSFGIYGTTTGAPNLESFVTGNVGKLNVVTDIKDVRFQTQSGSFTDKIGSVYVGGSLIGGNENFSGYISSSGGIGLISIQGDLIGDLGFDSASIRSRSIGNVQIGGSVFGGNGTGSASILTNGTIGPVTIRGNIYGGSGSSSGSIYGVGIGPVTIGGSIQGSIGDSSATITSIGDLGIVSVRGNTIAGLGLLSAGIFGHGNLAGVNIIGSAGAPISGGNIGKINIQGDFKSPQLSLGASIRSYGKIGSINIGGSAYEDIRVDGGLASLVIRGNLNGVGIVEVGGAIGKVNIGGSLGNEISAGGNIATVVLGGDLLEFATISSAASISTMSVRGSVIGSVISPSILTTKLSGNLMGNIFATDKIGTVVIDGSVIGGNRSGLGLIDAGEIGKITINGDLKGGSESSTGSIKSRGSIATITVRGSVIGDSFDSGIIFAETDIGKVVIGGDLVGGLTFSGSISAFGNVANINIRGSVVGGGSSSGSILVSGAIGNISAKGDILGGTGGGSGIIQSLDGISKVSVGGSVQAGRGGSSGRIYSAGRIGNIIINGDLNGISFQGNPSSGTPLAENAGTIQARSIQNLTLGGSLIAGDSVGENNSYNGSIRVEEDIETLLIRGSIQGGRGYAIISAGGSATPTTSQDRAIGRLTVLGSVREALILAGVNPDGFSINADAQIGVINIRGDLIASSIAAGVSPINGYYGDFDDVKMSGFGVKDTALRSSIHSVIIGGQVVGVTSPFFYRHFGIVAELISSVRIGGVLLQLTTGFSNDVISLGITGNFQIREI
jgi:hypothetical protein